MIRIAYLCVLWYLWFCPMLRAQHAYSVQHYGVDEGLLSHAVLGHTMQSNEGYLYTISNDGIIRFDGHSFEWLPAASRLSDTHAFNTLYQDSKNRLWYGSRGRGFGVLSGADTLHFSQPGYVQTITKSPDNILWIGADGNGLWQLDLKADSLIPRAVFTEALGRTIHDIAPAGAGRLFVGTNEGLFAVNYQTMEFSQLAAGNVLAVNTDTLLHEKSLLFSTSEGLFRKSYTGNKIIEIRHPQLSWPPVDIMSHPGGGYLILTLHALYLYKNNTLTQLYARDDAVFYSAAIDHEKNIWIGTETDGLIQLIPTPIYKFTTENGLPSKVATVILQSRNDTVYVGTTSGLALTTPAFRNPKILFKTRFISTLFEDDEGTIWVGLRNEGLQRIGPNSVHLYTPADGLPSPYIWTMDQDHNGRLLAGTLKGVAVFEPASNRWKPLFTAENGILQHNDVRAILSEGKGRYWVGTSFGLHHITADSVTIYDTDDGLDHAVILDLVEDSNKLWVGTSGGGLYRFNNGTFRQIPTDWTGTKIWRLLPSGRELWFTSQTGIHAVHLDSLNNWLDKNAPRPEILQFNQHDGLPGALVGALQPSGWKLNSGEFWFPTFNGIAVLPDTLYKPHSPAPPLTINYLVAGADTLLPHQPVTLSHFKGHVNIRYTGFSFKNPDLLSYSYKLQNFDDHWNHVGPRRTAIYTNLPPGRYQFQVKAQIGKSGIFSKSASLPLTILPYFYETWWFRGMMVVLLGLAIWGIVYYRKLQRTRLQKLRVQIAHDLHDEIGSNLGSILLRSHMLGKNKNLGRSERTTLNEINRISRETAVSMRDIIWLIHPEKDKIEDLNLKLRHIASQLLGELPFDYTYQGPENTQQVISLEKRRNIIFIYKEMLHNIVKHARADEVTITITVSDNQFRLEITDNGCGFNPEQVHKPGLGLKSMRERAETINGFLSIHSNQADSGTSCVLEVSIP